LPEDAGQKRELQMHGFHKSRPYSAGQRPSRRRNRYLRNGQCAAALRAVTAARILLELPVRAGSIAEAALLTGSCPAYVAAAVALIGAEDAPLEGLVRRGQVPLLKAAATVKKRAALIKAYREATPADLAALARTVGPAAVFDNVVAPAL
jgi:hypothetical protein